MLELMYWSMKGICTCTWTPKNLSDEWCKQISRKYLSNKTLQIKNIHKSFIHSYEIAAPF